MKVWVLITLAQLTVAGEKPAAEADAFVFTSKVACESALNYMDGIHVGLKSGLKMDVKSTFRCEEKYIRKYVIDPNKQENLDE